MRTVDSDLSTCATSESPTPLSPPTPVESEPPPVPRVGTEEEWGEGGGDKGGMRMESVGVDHDENNASVSPLVSYMKRVGKDRQEL